eukprot:COSAG01_NODE_9838_length_2326_cov_73.564885_4_plen_291_part_00
MRQWTSHSTSADSQSYAAAGAAAQPFRCRRRPRESAAPSSSGHSPSATPKSSAPPMPPPAPLHSRSGVGAALARAQRPPAPATAPTPRPDRARRLCRRRRRCTAVPMSAPPSLERSALQLRPQLQRHAQIERAASRCPSRCPISLPTSPRRPVRGSGALLCPPPSERLRSDSARLPSPLCSLAIQLPLRNISASGHARPPSPSAPHPTQGSRAGVWWQVECVARARGGVCAGGGAGYVYYGAVVVVPAAVALLALPWYGWFGNVGAHNAATPRDLTGGSAPGHRASWLTP